MELRSAQAILLDVFDLQERDRIVAFLTAEYGKKRGVARGSRAKYSRFAGQLQPLAKVDVRWFERDGRELVRISDVALIRPATALQRDLEGILLGAYLAEHLSEFAQEDEPSGPFFRLLDTSLEALLAGTDRALVARYLEIWVLRLAGIFPVPRACPFCGRPFADRAVLLESDAALVCPDCARSDGGRGFEIGSGELELLRRSGRENLEHLAQAPPPPPVLATVERLCGRVRRHFLQKELKSYRVMRDTLDGLGSG